LSQQGLKQIQFEDRRTQEVIQRVLRVETLLSYFSRWWDQHRPELVHDKLAVQFRCQVHGHLPFNFSPRVVDDDGHVGLEQAEILFEARTRPAADRAVHQDEVVILWELCFQDRGVEPAVDERGMNVVALVPVQKLHLVLHGSHPVSQGQVARAHVAAAQFEDVAARRQVLDDPFVHAFRDAGTSELTRDGFIGDCHSVYRFGFLSSTSPPTTFVRANSPNKRLAASL